MSRSRRPLPLFSSRSYRRRQQQLTERQRKVRRFSFEAMEPRHLMTAVNDNYEVDYNQLLSVSAPGVLANDTDIGLLDHFDAQSTLGAKITWQRDGSFSYDPRDEAIFQDMAPGDELVDTFTYLLYDPREVESVGTVQVTVKRPTVTEVNHAPVAAADALVHATRSPVTVAAPGLLSNDTDPDANDTITVASFDQNSVYGAEISVQPDGSYTYTPTDSMFYNLLPGQKVTDTFTYTIRDADGLTSEATVSVEYTETIAVPVIFFGVDANKVLEVDAISGLTGHRPDPEGKPVTLVSADNATQFGAQLTVNPDGSFRYDPRSVAAFQALNRGEYLEDSFRYVVTDGTLTGSGEISILVIGQPNGAEDLFQATAEKLTEFPAPGVLANDVSGATITDFDAVSAKGAKIVLRADGSFQYDPTLTSLNTFLAPGESELDEFTYTTRDAAGNTQEVIVSVKVIGYDHPFTPASDEYEADSRTILRVPAPGLLKNDFDVDNLGGVAAVTLKVADGPIYRPGDANRDGVFDSTDLVDVMSAGEYEDTIPDNSVWEEGDWNLDGDFDSTDLVLAMSIGGYEDPKFKPTSLAGFDLNGDNQVNDLDRMLASQDSASRLGAKVDVRADGSFTYDPSTSAELLGLAEGEYAVDEFVYLLTDASGRQVPSYVQVTVRGRARDPEAAPDHFETSDSVLNGDTYGWTVLENDRSFAPDTTLKIVAYEVVSKFGAAIELGEDGTIYYDPTNSDAVNNLDLGEQLLDEFLYTIEDVNGRRSTAKVEISVYGSHSRGDDLYLSDTDRTLEVIAPGVLANDPAFVADPQVVVLSFDSSSELGATVVMRPDGSFEYDARGVEALMNLEVGQTVYDSFTYSTESGANAGRHRVNVVLKGEKPAAIDAAFADDDASDSPNLPPDLVQKVGEVPEYGMRYVAEFYEGLPEIIGNGAIAPTSRYQYEILPHRGVQMLKIQLLTPLGGDSKQWRIEANKLIEQVIIRTGHDTATKYTVEHVLPDPSTYQMVWLLGYDRGANRFMDIANDKPIIYSGGIERDIVDAANFQGSGFLPGEVYTVSINTAGGDDIVRGTHLKDRIDVAEGNDKVTARAGDDLILAGPGKDTVDGNEDRNLVDPGPSGEGDSITNATIITQVPSLDVIQRKLTPKELSKTKEEKVIWLDDMLPTGAQVRADLDYRPPAEVTKANGEVKSGSKAYTLDPNSRGFFFDKATTKLTPVKGDTLVADVYIDPAAVPSRLAVRFGIGTSWLTEYYWGTEPTLTAGQELKQGESLYSADGMLQLILQTDGNLVLYHLLVNRVVWATNRLGGTRAVMQTDGNFVVYRGNGSVAWASGTTGNNARLTLQNDGNLVLLGNDNTAKWSSGTVVNRDPKPSFFMGEMPNGGEWTTLEMKPEDIGLAPGTALDGFLVRALGGKVTFDNVGIARDKDKDDPEMSVKLSGDILSILGSENYGFQIQGNWSITNNDGAETFSAVGAMKLISKIGEIPFVSPPINIPTKTDGEPGFGIVNAPTITFGGMDFKTTAIGALNDVFEKIGLNMTLSGIQFGVSLGKTLSNNLLKSVGAPLVDSIPYIFFSNFNAPQISYGEIGIGVDNTAGLAIVFDPADPFIFVSGMDPRGDVLAVGLSKNGYIPYNPLRTLDKRMGDDLYGNIYARGKIVFPVQAVDIGVDGELTIDADLNDDGKTFFDQFDKGYFHRLIKGVPGNDADKFVESILDLGVGLNGKLTVGLGKKGIGIEIPVGTASALFKGNKFAFNGGSVNPWQGTFLEKFNNTGEVEINGYFGRDAFEVNAKMATAKYAALQVKGNIRFTNRDIAAELETASPIPNFPTFKIKGNIAFNGNYKFYAESRRGVDFGPFGAEMYMGLGFSRMEQTYQIDAAFGAGIRMNVLICKDLELNFKASGLVGFGEVFEYNFRGNFRIFCDTPWYVPGPDIGPFDLGFGIDNRGFTLPLPGPLPNLRVNF